jgi:hypothetical protein
MRKTGLILLAAGAFLTSQMPPASAQVIDTSAIWIWKNGINGTTRYQIDNEKMGTKGTPYTMITPPPAIATHNNWPGSKSDGAYWSDTAGYLYFFGGAFNDQNGFNQLWKIDPDNNTWTWVHGKPSYTSSVAFGQLLSAAGVPHPDNMPQARYSTTFAADSAGHLWVFGGLENTTSNSNNIKLRNDLWKYDPYSNQWTYFNGATGLSSKTAGVYGTKNLPAQSNQPGSRGYGPGVAWVDNKTAKFYMFSGNGAAKSGSADGILTDFWSFDMNSKMWTWIGGGDSATTSLVADYGQKGVPAASNFPQPRFYAASWTDKDGNFWMFGGYTTVWGKAIYLNDMWRYNPSDGLWTWMHGDKIDTLAMVKNGNNYGYFGVSGQKGVPSPNNKPGSRQRPGRWVDAYGRLWLFGGLGLSETSTTFTRQNDIWMYDPATNEWTWMYGSKDGYNTAQGVPGNYVSTPAAFPGGRDRAMCWVDKKGNVWTFGGNGGGTTGEPATRSDLWKLEGTAPAAPPGQPGAFTASKAAVCEGESVVYTVPAVVGATSYEWEYTGTGATFSGTTATATPTNTVTFSTAATNGVLKVRAKNVVGTSPSRDMSITINPLPVATSVNTGNQTICDGDSLLLSASTSSGVTYQWKNGTTNVATGPIFYAKTSGTYTVTVTNTTTNCSATSSPATSLTVNPRPTAVSTNTGNQFICDGDSLQLSATTSAGVSYQWKNGNTNVGTGSVFYAKASGNYTVTVTNTTTNCSATSSPATNLTVYTLPTVSSTNTGTRQICQGDSLELIASSSGPVSYEWRLGNVVVGTNATYHASIPGSYTVTVTNTNTNCKATSSPATVLTVNSLPNATVTLSGPSTFCSGDSVVLTAGTGVGYNYQWKNGNTNVGTGGDQFAAYTSGNYRVVVTDGATGCKDSTQDISITVHNRPQASLVPGDTAFCIGGVVTLNVSTTDTGLTYIWKDGQSIIPLATAHFLEINETGTYRVIVSRDLIPGCEDSTNEVTVTVHPLPTVDIRWDDELLHATAGYASYQWYISQQAIIGATDSTFRPSMNGNYSVAVTDNNGCSNTSQVENVRNVSVSDLDRIAAQIQVYPNPARDVIHIQSPVPVRVVLRAIDGRLLQQQENPNTLHIGSYAEGVYLLQITDIDGVLLRHEKIVKRQ